MRELDVGCWRQEVYQCAFQRDFLWDCDELPEPDAEDDETPFAEVMEYFLSRRWRRIV